jgi:hypothetical protein
LQLYLSIIAHISKNKLIMQKGSHYLLIILLLGVFIAGGCIKNTTPPNLTAVLPTGNFIGQFTLIHKNSATSKFDTAHAIITIAMMANATYAVAGDTTKIQAASNGSFNVDTPDGIITFNDATVTKLTSLNTPKKHLNGPFLYTYDGANLHIFGSSDTLSYNYALTAY